MRHPTAGPGLLLGLVALSAVAGAGCFPSKPGPHLQHFSDQAPSPGGPAPDFVLRDLEGRPFRLQDLLGDGRPVVLQLGSHSCPVYRYRRFGMRQLYEEFGDRVHFLIVYTREAHPKGSPSPFTGEEWDVWINRLLGVRVEEPRTYDERLEQASRSRARLQLQPTVLVDEMDDEVWKAFGAAASPGFVIGPDGTVALRLVWIDPEQIRGVLDELLTAG